MAEIKLDEHADLVLQYRHAQKLADDWKAVAENLKAKIQELMGEHDTASVGGLPAFTWKHNGNFEPTRFRTEQPELWKQYQRTTTTLDTKALANDHPEVYAAYRGRKFNRA